MRQEGKKEQLCKEAKVTNNINGTREFRLQNKVGKVSEPMETNMEKKTSSLKLYMHYLQIIIKSAMQYKASFFMMAFGQFMVSFSVLIGVYYMFQRFSNVKGFTYSEVLLCFSIMLMEFSLAEIWARGFDTFPSMIRQGTFDRVLLRPRNEVLQVLGSSQDSDSPVHAGGRSRAVFRFVFDLCGTQLFYIRGT